MIVIGVAGGSGSGKSTFVANLRQALGPDPVPVMPQDAYYHDQGHLELAERQKQNYDHPDAIEWTLLGEHLQRIRQGGAIVMPRYSMLTCTREAGTEELRPSAVLVVEGILLFSDPGVRGMIDLRVFLDVSEQDRYQRIVQRDIAERGRTEEMVRQRYEETVRPMYSDHILPTKRYAHVLVAEGGKNLAAVDLVAATAMHMRDNP